MREKARDNPGDPAALAGRLFRDMVGALELLSVYLGERLGLYQALHAGGPATSAELAARTGTTDVHEDDAGRPCGRRWTVRVSIDEAESLGLQPYQWVHLQLPGRPATRAFFHGGCDAPPFAMLTFER